MVYVCVICTSKDIPLRIVNGEARELLEVVVSPVVDLHPLRFTQMLACEGCQKLLETVLTFQKTALVGINNLLSMPYYKQLFRGYVMGPEAGPGAWPPILVPPCMRPTCNSNPTLLVTPLIPQSQQSPTTSTEAVEQPAPARPGPSSDYHHMDGGSEDPQAVAIKTEQDDVPVEIDVKLEIEHEPETLREQLTHEVDIKLEPGDGAEDPAESPSETDSASDFEEASSHTTTDEPMTRELATPDEPLITTFTHIQRPANAVSGPSELPDDLEETLRKLPKLPKLYPRPQPAARGARGPAPGAMSTLTPRPAISQLESSVQAMEAHMPSFSASVAQLAGRAPSSAAPAPPDQQSAPQSWYVRVLPGAEVERARAAALAEPGFAGARHQCRACVLAFRCETGKALHDKTHHPFTDGRYLCRTCGHREGEVDAWRAHVRSHATRYCCCYCPFSTGDAAAVRQHYCEPKLQQWEKSNFVKGIFKDKQRIRKKVPLPEKCAQCYSRFADKPKLERHQERMHSKPEEPQTCTICNKQLKNKISLYHHMYLHRKQEQVRLQPALRAELHCVECDRGFDTPSAFRQHQLSVKHGGREHWKHECDQCKRVFATKSRVRQHIQIVHLKQRNYKCSACPARLSTASRLRHHERSHGPQARPHVCHLCEKSYTIKKSLKEHLLAHAGLRPHLCKLCPATFTYSAALFTHHRLKHLKIKKTWRKKAAKDETKGKVARTKRMTMKKVAADDLINV